MSEPTPEVRAIIDLIPLNGPSDKRGILIAERISAAIRAAEERGREEGFVERAEAAEKISGMSFDLECSRNAIAAARLAGWEECREAIRQKFVECGMLMTAEIVAALTPPAKEPTNEQR